MTVRSFVRSASSVLAGGALIVLMGLFLGLCVGAAFTGVHLAMGVCR